jgi:hypothetical protein
MNNLDTDPLAEVETYLIALDPHSSIILPILRKCLVDENTENHDRAQLHEQIVRARGPDSTPK